MTELGANIRRSFVSQGIGMLLRLAVSVLIARALGPQARGELALALWVPNLFNAIFYFSLGEATLALLHRSGHPHDVVVGSLNSLALASIGLGSVLYFGLAPWILGLLKSQLPWGLYVLSFPLFPITLLWACWAAVHLGWGHVMRVNWGRVFNQGVLLGVLVLCVRSLPRNAWIALSAYLAAAGVELTWLGYWLAQRRSLKLCWAPSIQRQQMRLGAQTTLAVWIGACVQRLDLVLVNGVAGATGVGLYAVAAGLRDFALALPETFVRPVLSEASRTRDRSSGVSGLGGAFRQALGLLILLALGLGVAMPWVVQLLYSTAFSASVAIGRWLLVGFVAFSLSNLLATALMGFGKPLPIILGQVGSLVALLGASWWLGPRQGVAGVAMSISLSQWVGLAVLLAALARRDPALLRALIGVGPRR